MKSPFKFLESYGIKDRDVFFGREKEIDTLYSLVYKTPLTLLYGLSGTGKTSIIQCGLANRFEGPDWLPFYIRREENINDSLKTVLTKALDEITPDGLPEIISALFDDYLRPVYLIFDQFEELLILGSPEEQKTFAENLQVLIDRKLPCRVIFVIREEYLGQLYLLEREIPSLFDFRLRIEPMSNTRVLGILKKSFETFNITIQEPGEELLQTIIDNVSSGKSWIQLPFLQIYLDTLYKAVYALRYGEEEWEEEDVPPPLEITQQDILDFGKIENVLDKFLIDQTQKLQEELSDKYSNLPDNAALSILDAFVTIEGTKRPIHFDREEEVLIPKPTYRDAFPNLSFDIISDCIRSLEHSRLLKLSESTVELTHDSLAALIDQRRSDEQRQLNEVKKRIAAAYLEKEKSGVYLTERQLISMEEFLPKINLKPHLQQFIADCEIRVANKKAAAEKERQQKLEAARQQAAEERELRTHSEEARMEADKQRTYAQKNAKQAKTRSIIASALAVLALVLAISVYNQSEKTKALAEKTEEQRRIYLATLLELYQLDIRRLDREIEISKQNQEAFKRYEAYDVAELERHKIDSLTSRKEEIDSVLKKLQQQ